jgi:hypothetical protein
MLRPVGWIVLVALTAILVGAASLALVQAQSQSRPLPEMPRRDTRLYVTGLGGTTECTVSEIVDVWVKCDGVWRNLSTGAAYTIQKRE